MKNLNIKIERTFINISDWEEEGMFDYYNVYSNGIKMGEHKFSHDENDTFPMFNRTTAFFDLSLMEQQAVSCDSGYTIREGYYNGH